MTQAPNPSTPELAERLMAWADSGDMGRPPDPTDLRRQAAARIAELERALEPFVTAYETRFKRYERANSNWHHEMPGEWPIELMLMVADCRNARSTLNNGGSHG